MAKPDKNLFPNAFSNDYYKNLIGTTSSFAKTMSDEIAKTSLNDIIGAVKVPLIELNSFTSSISHIPSIPNAFSQLIEEQNKIQNIFSSLEINPSIKQIIENQQKIFNNPNMALNDSLRKLKSSQINLCKTLENINGFNIPSNFFNFDFLNYKDINTSNYDEDKINKLNNKIEYLSISNNIKSDRINDIKEIITEVDMPPSEEFLTTEQNMVPIEEILPHFISYAYAKKSKDDLTDAYNKSNLQKIINEAELVCKYIKDINTIVADKTKKDVFTYNSYMLDLVSIKRHIVVSDNGLNQFSNILFKSIYESSGVKSNRIIKLMDYYQIENHHPIFILIKKIRCFYDHKNEKDSDNNKKTLKYFREVLGKTLPDTPSDWVKLQLSIYTDIRKMLQEIYNKLNNDIDNSSLASLFDE